MTASHPFDVAMQLEAVEGNLRRGRTQPEWASMVSPFGGITAAVLVQAIQTHPERIGEPLALTVNFAAPISDGEFDISLCAARTNRTTQHWTVDLTQHGEVRTTATALFGIRRAGWEDTEARLPVAPPPERLARDSAQGDFVGWARLFDLRFAEGSFPGAGAAASPSAVTTMWMRDNAKRHIDHPAIAALCDIFCPRAFLRHGGAIPAGTVSLTTYFHADQHQLDALAGDYVLGTARAGRFSGGYFDQSAQLWTRDGVLLAISHQLVYFKG